jgi:hypothetical protein
VLVIAAQARSIDELNEFIEALEATGDFRNVVPIAETTMENGLIEANMQATYIPPARRPEAATP